MKHAVTILFLLFTLFIFNTNHAQANSSDDDSICTKAVEYTSSDGVVLKGYIAYDQSIEGKRPGVLVVHEWWGHNDYARRRARLLARMGYTALAIDMYGDGKEALHPDDAGKFAGMVAKNQDLARARFLSAMELLKKHDSVDPTRIAAIGYCFGGSIVLNMARSGIDLKGVASFHGGLSGSKSDKPGKIKARLFVAHGALDAMEPPEHVERFKAEMEAEGADMRFISYEGALHSFTNPAADEYAEKFNLPLGYNKKADKASWNELKTFL
ncbi:MAG: dienelactone hydrolase family protein, partial [Thermodesulfobacteriota bacterium]